MRLPRARALGPILLLTLARCDGPRKGVDLLASPERLIEAKVSGRDREWVLHQAGKMIRVDDVGYRTLPASPESRIVYKLDVPKRAHLSLAYTISSDYHDRPGVEFTVKLRAQGREETAFQNLLDPLSKPSHRTWQNADVDLTRFSGKDVELALETRSFDSTGDELRRAYWGAPAITLPDQKAALAIVYLVDTLRADHTTPYGYERDTTPALALFAKESVLFETAVAQAPWTKPSVASILTSKLPGQHRAVQLRDPLDLGLLTLPEMLQAKGFATGAAIANSVIYSAGSNFEQGFDAFVGLHDAEGRASKEVPAGPVVDAALRFLDSRRGVPTFLYVHTMDPHVPYTPPPPFDTKWTPHPAKDHPGADPRTDYKEPQDRERLIAQYDGDIAYGDQEFGRFVRELRSRGLFDSALVVFMADHGEEFLDHGQWLHGRSVFDELIHIPLLVKFPGGKGAGTRVKQQVQSVDVLPTVLEELGLPVLTPPAIAGHALRAVVDGGAPEPPAVSEVSSRGYVAHGMRTGKDKYVQSFSPLEGELFFDLMKDPKEKTNIIEANRERARLLRAEVEAAMVHDPFRRHIRFSGSGLYELRLRTPGWLDGVEPVGLGASETSEVADSGRKLVLRVRPRPGAPREVMLSVRPMAAPVWLEGTRDGRPLRVDDVAIAEPGFHPKQMPFKLPEIEPDDEDAKFENVLVPPKHDPPGIQLWLTPVRERSLIVIDKDNCEKLRALGYIGKC